MRILIIHNHYQEPGGEDVVFEQEEALLSETEDVFSLTFQNQKSWFGMWQTLWSPWNIWAGQKVRRAIRKYGPDIIHIHNLHYAIGPIAVRIAKRRGIPVVMTLHNYRLICPSATLFNNGKLFTDSFHVNFPWKAVRLGVHSGSSIKTFWLALTNWLHKKTGTWFMVDCYITLTDFARQLFVQSTLALPAEKITVKPNFVPPPNQIPVVRGSHFLFIGRLTPEKGIDVLLEAFSDTDQQLRIAGNGPLQSKVVAACHKHTNITYLGALDKSSIEGLLATCSALIFPSIWYEGMPMTLLEAFAAGTPAIASDLGAMHAMIHDGGNGYLFPAGNTAALRQRVEQWAELDETEKHQLCKRARLTYEQHYTAAANRELLLEVYRSALQSNH